MANAALSSQYEGGALHLLTLSELVREAGGMQDALGLKKMTAFMADNDLQSGTDGESNSRDERIPKADAVDVFGARADHEFPAGFVSGEKAFENGSANVRRGPDLRWSRSSLGDRRLLIKLRINQRPNHPGVICPTGESGFSLTATEMAGR